MSVGLGAFESEWDHFTLVLGLDKDLLPAVADPDAKIAEISKIKVIGKTPSRFSSRGEIVGFVDWTAHETTSEEIDRWSKEPRYSISLQTRTIRAFDIDVPDAGLSLEISKFIFSRVGLLPVRLRSNSGKQLLAFSLPGDYAKRVMKVEGGIIEFLATGQQFIACGNHFDNSGKPSGARYEWAAGLPPEFPSISAEQFEVLWEGMTAQFALEAPSEGRSRLPKAAAANTMNDPVARYLADTDRVLSFGKEGQLFICCPFKEEHTSNSGESETAYFPMGGRKYKQGHFVCLHAHCAGRPDHQFLTEIGYLANDFQEVTATKELKGDLPWPGFKRDKSGAIKTSLNNLFRALRSPAFAGLLLKYDSFRDEVVIYSEELKKWFPLSDTMQIDLRAKFEEHGFESIGREIMRDAVTKVAAEFTFDSAQDWLNGLVWDGTPRIENFMSSYMQSEDSPYAQAVSLYMWTAMAGRVLEPGIKADMVPIWIGPQGRGKSSTAAALVPSPEFFTEISLQDKDDNLSRLIRGRLVAEIGELRGLQSRDLESNNAFITRTHEKWIPKFREFATIFPRRLIFIGTTNQEEFLADETGNRRWLPIHIKQADLPAIRRDREQLWAEARETFNMVGIAWEEAERLARDVHAQHMITDSWQEQIEKWMLELPFEGKDRPCDRPHLRIGEIMTGALSMSGKQIHRADESRVYKILRKLGYGSTVMKLEGITTRVWKPERKDGK